MTRTLVAFGDSNTWGAVPGSTTGERFPRDQRWPVILQRALGEQWEVITEGLGGRTATVERPDSEGRNGLPYLFPCLHTHKPVDLLVIYLGTNDVYLLDEDMVARSVVRLVRVARASESGPNGAAPQVLVVCPPPFDGHQLGPAFAQFCALIGCELLDLDGVATYPVVNGDVDHLDAGGHAAVAHAVEERVRKLFP